MRLVALFRRNAGILSEVSAIAAADCRLIFASRVAASIHFPLQLLEGTPPGQMVRMVWFPGIAGLNLQADYFC